MKKPVDVGDILRRAARTIVLSIVTLYEMVEKRNGQRNKNADNRS